jgi:hypothetical protein
MQRSGKLRLDLFDAAGDALNERVDVYLYHQSLSDTVAVRGVNATRPFLVKNLLSSPQGLYRLFIDPPSYLPVSVFVNIEAQRVVDRALAFPVDPKKVIRVQFPNYREIAYSHSLLDASGTVLGFAGMAGEQLYKALDDIRRAGLLNILAKSRRTPVSGGGVVLDSIRELREVRGDRFYAVVTHELREHVKNSIAADLFREVDGTLHRPPDGYQLAGSYKTLDSYGNLQLTFFANGDSWMADIDIDDAAGIAHVFQVVRNSITGAPTHPYNIRDILLRYQEIDPGYRFVLREETKVATAGRGA